MSRAVQIRRHAVPLLVAAAAVALLVLAGRWPPAAPEGVLARPWLWLGFTALVAAGALHRPLGGRTLGMGTAALPPIAVAAGAASAGWAAAVALLAAELVSIRGAAAGPEGDETAGAAAVRSAAEAARSALAVLAGGLTAAGLSARGWTLAPAAAVAAGTYLALSLLLDVVLDRAAAGRWRFPGLDTLQPYALDLTGWALGTAAVAVGLALGWGLGAVPVAAAALLAAEAARNAHLAAGARQRLASLDRVRRAGQRMIASGSEIDSVVERIRAECANVVGAGWFHLELLAATANLAGTAPAGAAGPASWQAGPEGLLAPGRPEPGASPPPLPGVHRRGAWRVIERELGSEAGRVARLRLWCDPRRLADDDLELLDALLPQMAASLQQALLDREAREDALTGAAVRRVLERRLLESYAAACEQGGTLAVILCDLDHFKRINDTHGHAAGDRALAAAGAALAGAKRGRDLLARYGGEEFALLLESTDGETALAVAERLRRRVAAIVPVEDGPPGRLTLSAGVAAFPELHVKTASELLLLADEALYEAKGRGRNRCLLNLGQGRYLAPDGTVAETEARPPAPRPPRLFA